MQRPEVRQIEGQRVESEREVTGYEAEELLRKYGYDSGQYTTRPDVQQPVAQPGLTFEEMLAQEEEKQKREEQMRFAQMNGPKPITFGGQSGYDSEIKYSSDDELGFGIRVEITTDMKLPKY
jgi:hypothetical protein